MQVKNRTIYFPSFMRISAYDFKGKIKKKEIKRIVQNEDFGENIDSNLSGTADIRSYYTYYDKKKNNTYLEICEFPKPHDKGSYVLPQLVLRNSVTEYPCIVIIPDENITVVFNQYGLMDSYFKDTEFNLDEKVNYFQANFPEYDLIVFSTQNIDTYRVELIELSENWQQKGKNELIGANAEKRKLNIPSQKVFGGLCVVILVAILGISVASYQQSKESFALFKKQITLMQHDLNNIKKDLKDKQSDSDEVRKMRTQPHQEITLKDIKNEIKILKNMLTQNVDKNVGNPKLPDAGIANIPANQKIINQNILKAKKRFTVSSYSSTSNILILKYFPYPANRQITETITIDMDKNYAKYGTNDYKFNILQKGKNIIIKHNLRPKIKFNLKYKEQ